ncbi:codanin-1-like [Denticeps clupeoides]|uniref:codanin-1-like n=1 Tax=Denticeps clupeoides TaxID=299321 RepID=UPI0010A3CD4A|nr:codanin-1-like [Denticeps clupeoides]
MAALLESLLLGKVEAGEAAIWLRNAQDLTGQTFCKPLEFVPFLLNFLRDQCSHTLAHGPATPAKMPSCPKASLRPSGGSGGRGRGSGLRGSRVQLFSPPASLSPPGASDVEACEAAATPTRGVQSLSASSSPSFSSGWSPGPRQAHHERRSAQRSCLGDFLPLSPPEAQQSSPAPAGGHHRGGGRKRSGGSAPTSGGRQGGLRGHQQDGAVACWENVGQRGRGGGGAKGGERQSPPTRVQVNSLEDFPPMSATQQATPVATKPSRRINPTPVNGERPHSRPKSCFTSTPLSKPCSPPAFPECTGAAEANVGSPLSLREEREMLKRERTKLAQQMGSPLKAMLDPCTPTKAGTRLDSRVTPDPPAPCPDPAQVTLVAELDLLAVIYCTCIRENLVPSVFLELFFTLQLLTSRSPSPAEGDSVGDNDADVLERGYFRSVHNCVYFAVKVLEDLFELLSHMDKCTLRLLAENERVGLFAPALREQLLKAQDVSTAKVSSAPPSFVHSVSFQPATDNRSNFSSDKAFHIFKKQRDIFYELLRDWEDFHKEPGWQFEAALGGRVRAMVSQLTAAGNHAHFARLFQKQLIQMCKDPRGVASHGDAPDADLLGMLGADSLGRLKRLQERLIQPQGLMGPCPPPSFPGHQEFFRDFLQTASCCQLNQHLKDSLWQELLQLDEVSILGPAAGTGGEGQEEAEGDLEQQDEKQRFSSVLLLARLLAKFLGFISFLPYQTSQPPSREIQEAAIAVRSRSVPVLDVCSVLHGCVRRRRMVLTVPWLVEFLSMLDFTGPYLPCYRTALGLLLHLYRRMVLGRGEVCYLNQMLLVAVLGWLFQIPMFPEDMIFREQLDLSEDFHASSQGLDSLPLVDQELLYTCCPYLGEFRKLLAAFVSGSTAKSGGLVRKITPTSAEPRGPPSTRSQQKLEVELEQAFFHNQPPSLRRTVEFVAERVGSNSVKHIKATLVSELVRGGERSLREAVAGDGASVPKINDVICARLCDAGMQALEEATRFCSEKGPVALKVLLPEETSPAVLSTAERITKRLATEKACTWLSANITVLIKREWKSTFERVMKSLPNSEEAKEKVAQSCNLDPCGTCAPHCTHQAPRASSVINEMKEVLSVAAGPRDSDETFTVPQLQVLLERVGRTLACRKFMSAVPEQMLLHCTVLLACRLVSGELPLRCPAGGDGVRTLLGQLAALLGSCSSPGPLQMLFSSPTLAAISATTDWERNNFLFLVQLLLDKGLVRVEQVLSLTQASRGSPHTAQLCASLSNSLDSLNIDLDN